RPPSNPTNNYPKWVALAAPRDRFAWRRGGTELGELGAAGPAAARGGHRVAADRALGAPLGDQLVPGVQNHVLERGPARLEERVRRGLGAGLRGRRRLAGGSRGRGHQTLLKTPTTRPRTFASRVRIGL